MNKFFGCSLAGRTAIIVAAEGIQALHLRKVLTHVGIQVLDIFFSVDQTLRITEDYKPDLVLLDIGALAEDEAEIASRVLASGACLILLSYLPEEQIHDAASEWGAHGYISKPVGQEQIIARLQEAWSRQVLMSTVLS
jgi:DNA-binding response OmpR family regulator